ncbi:MAG: DUF2905 domain-containing protein [Deltaproteobacteria bacterium]|nr:DUF2905 domain-containing protein [Deltaproteobacteria bacterium]
MADLGKLLIALGGLIVVVGAVLLVGEKLPWVGRLPGDIYLKRDHFTFYFPLTTCLLVSALLSLLFFLFRR